MAKWLAVLICCSWVSCTASVASYLADKNADCSKECTCHVGTSTCISKGDGLPFKVPEDTHRLSLINYGVEHLTEDAFRRLWRLKWLTITSGTLEIFPKFPNLSHLTYLDLSENRITSLTLELSSSLPYLTHLNLSSNNIELVDDAFLKTFKHMKVLDLSYNMIIQITSSSALRYTNSLYILYLDHNKLSNLPRNLLGELKFLYQLNLSHNSITQLPHISNPSLTVLDISHNPLLHIPALHDMRGLEELYASYSNISQISKQALNGAKNLRILDISNSFLETISNYVFDNCENLQELRISNNNQLKRIDEKAFSGLNKLESVDLSYCPVLQELENGLFYGLEQLKEVSLQLSGISVLPVSLGNVSKDVEVNLKSLKLLCDCHAYWVPEWLISRNKTMDVNCKNGNVLKANEFKALIDMMNCQETQIIPPCDTWVLANWGQSALLECNATGEPVPTIIWQTVDHQVLVHNTSIENKWVGRQIASVLATAKTSYKERLHVLQSGQLLIQNVTRDDIGRYKCFAFNPMSFSSSVMFMGLDDKQFRALIIESILFGFACAALFLLVTLFVQFLRFLMERLCWECCCCQNQLSPKAKQIRRLLESVETYKSQQLDRLKENYNSQVVSIKESCYQQMERLRESYAHQTKNLRELKEYSTQQLTSARDQYLDQVNKIREYSLHQMNRVRENYVFQRHKIRKFSAHQLIKLRETYKYQQKTLNKLLETLPDLYIQNCRTGVCQRTDSVVFDDEIDGLDVYYKVDFLDNQSTSSDYYTPSNTLPRQCSKQAKHSRNTSTHSTSSSGEYHEILTYTKSNPKELDSCPPDRYHSRSHSLVVSALPESSYTSSLGHKRSVSASHPSPVPFMPRSPLAEESSNLCFCDKIPLSPVHTSTTSASFMTPVQSTLVTPSSTPTSLTPVHYPKLTAAAAPINSNYVSTDQLSLAESGISDA